MTREKRVLVCGCVFCIFGLIVGFLPTPIAVPICICITGAAIIICSAIIEKKGGN